MDQFAHVVSALKAEYPELATFDVTVERQFSAGLGRLSNTFLVATNSSNQRLRRFVAKGRPDNDRMDKFVTEIWALQTLAKRKPKFVPRLLIQDHEPVNFMLIEYLNGQTAGFKLTNGANVESVYAEIGKATADLHHVSLPAFGRPNLSIERWPVFLAEKMQERFDGAAKIIDASLAQKTKQFVTEIEPVLEVESVQPPVMIHRDIYVENFLFVGNESHATLIDYGMALGGRPTYDFAKFLILACYENPEWWQAFMHGYQSVDSAYRTSANLLRYYTVLELLGMIPFAKNAGRNEDLATRIRILEEVVVQNGPLERVFR